MATMDFTAVNPVLATLFENLIVTNINRNIVLAQLLQVSPGQGKNIQWVARVGTAVPAGAVIADGADVSTYNSDTKLAAVLQFGTYHDAFSITGKARAAAAAARNPDELADLLAEELMESVTRLAIAVAKDLYTGTGATNNINGLLSASGAAPGIGATGTYAGIDRSTYTQWQATVMSNGGTPRAQTLALLREMRRRIYVASGQKPDLIITDPIQHEKYGNLIDPQRRYIQDMFLRGQKITLDGGYQVLEFDGIPIVEDAQHPSGKMTFLNTRHVSLKQLPSLNGPNTRANMPLQGMPGEEQFGDARIPLSARLDLLAQTGDAMKFQLICYPQVQVKSPFTCGVLEDLL